MPFRPDILAGKAVILVSVQDNIDKQLRGIRTKLRRFSNSLGEIGGDLFKGGVIGSIGSALPVASFIKFQDQLLFLQTKLQVTDKEMLKLEKTIRRLGQTTSFTPKQVAEGATELAKAGFTLKEVTQALGPALDLSRGGQVDISTATAILANNLRTFQKDASFAGEFASKFITASRLGTLDIVDLNESLKESSGTFSNLNVNVTKALGLITTLSLSSLKGTKAGTSLNTAFTKLASNADKVNKLFGNGFNLSDEDLSRPLTILTKMGAVLSKMSRIGRVAAINDLDNIRGGRAIASILTQGLDQLEDKTQQIRASMDEARESAEKLDSRLGGVFRLGLSAAQELTLAIGATSEGPLTKFGIALRGVFTDLSAVVKANPEFVQTMLLIPPIAALAGAGMITFAFTLNKVASALTPVIGLNRLLFDTTAKIVGANLKVAKSGLKVFAVRKLTNRQIKANAKAAAKVASSLGAGGKGTASRSFLRRIVATRKAFQEISVPKKFRPIRPAEFTTSRLAAKALNSLEGGDLKAFKPRIIGIRLAEAVESNVVRDGYRRSLLTVLTKGTTNAVESAAFRDGYRRSLSNILISGARKVKIGPAIANIFKGGFFLFRKVDVVKGVVTGFVRLGKVLRGVFILLNTIRRFLFSFTGILTVLELLFLFGQNIPIVAKTTDVLATSFKALFSGIADTVKGLKPVFGSLSIALGRLFAGDFLGSIAAAKVAVLDFAAIIRTGLTAAWDNFVKKIAPVKDRLKEVFVGVLNVVTAIFDTLKEIFGLAANISGLGGGKDGESSIAKATSPENIRSFFAGILGFIKEIGKRIIDIVAFLSQILRAVLRVVSIIDKEPSKVEQAEFQVVAAGFTLKEAKERGENVRGAQIGFNLAKPQLREERANARVSFDAKSAKEALDKAFNKAIQITAIPKKPAGPGANADFKAAKDQAELNKNFLKLQDITKKGLSLGENLLKGGLNKLGLEKPEGPFAERIGNIIGQLANKLPSARPLVPRFERARVDVAAIQQAVHSVVGDFSSTRGNLVKVLTEDTQKKILKATEKTNETLDEINEKPVPVW